MGDSGEDESAEKVKTFAAQWLAVWSAVNWQTISDVIRWVGMVPLDHPG
jgi:hypothetical protein